MKPSVGSTAVVLGGVSLVTSAGLAIAYTMMEPTDESGDKSAARSSVGAASLATLVGALALVVGGVAYEVKYGKSVVVIDRNKLNPYAESM